MPDCYASAPRARPARSPHTVQLWYHMRWPPAPPPRGEMPLLRRPLRSTTVSAPPVARCALARAVRGPRSGGSAVTSGPSHLVLTPCCYAKTRPNHSVQYCIRSTFLNLILRPLSRPPRSCRGMCSCSAPSSCTRSSAMATVTLRKSRSYPAASSSRESSCGCTKAMLHMRGSALSGRQWMIDMRYGRDTAPPAY